jgi:hypothetical protein
MNVVDASHGNSANMHGVHIAYIVASRGGMMSCYTGRDPQGVSTDSVAATTKTSNVKYAN